MKLRLSLYHILALCLILSACISEPADDDDTSNTDSSSTELSSQNKSSSDMEVSSDNQMSSDNVSSEDESPASSTTTSSANQSSETNKSSRDEESSSSESDPISSSSDDQNSSSSEDPISSSIDASSSSNEDSSSSTEESSSSEMNISSSSDDSSSSEEPSSSSEDPQATGKVTGLNLAIERQIIQEISEGETIEIQREDNETINFYAIVEGDDITSMKFEATGWDDVRDEDTTPDPWAAHGQGVSFPDGETTITLKITPVEDSGEGTSLTITFTIKIPEEPSSSSEEPSSSSEISSSSDVSSSSTPTTTPAEEKSVSFETSDNVTIRATLGIPELDGNSKPAVIFIHAGGRSRSNWTSTDVYDDLWDQGFYVLAIDLRDHGSSDKPGTSDFYNNPNGAPRDVQAAIDYLEDIDDVDDSKIAIVGESVGGNLACVFSQDQYNVKTAVSMSSKTSAVVNLGDISGTPQLKNVFHISSVGDGGGDRKDWAEELYDYTSGERKVVSDYSGSGHGVSIFNSNPGAEQEIIDWILDTID